MKLLFLITAIHANYAVKAAMDTLNKHDSPLIQIYKTIDTVQLKLHIYHPQRFNPERPYPAIVFFFGGGWSNAHPDQFIPQASYLTAHGMVAILADYRVQNVHGTSPFEAAEDARSAIRFVKIHAAQLSVDTNRLVAAGGSAGGQLAAACDLINPDEQPEDPGISARPKALVLFNPVINNGPGNFGYSRVKERFREISPYHNIRKGAAPALILSGTADNVVGPNVIRQYKASMIRKGNRCDIHLYEGQAHGFYRYVKGGDNQYFDDTMRRVLAFLRSLSVISE